MGLEGQNGARRLRLCGHHSEDEAEPGSWTEPAKKNNWVEPAKEEEERNWAEPAKEAEPGNWAGLAEIGDWMEPAKYTSEALDSLPESLRGQPIVLLHGLTELLPGPSFCLHNHPGCSPLGLPVPVSCLRSPTSQPGPIGLLLQLDGILYFRCPPPGSGIAASTGTGDLTATAPSSRFDNGGGEHGPLRLNISSLPRDPVVAPPEVGVEDLSDRRLGQTFPANPYSTLGSAESVQPPPPPSDPTHHQVVIS
ncbi:uncharacterized protein LOC130095182 [Rhinichthys klamathensis goyatoka]|uniref:uncharacterized protein LOC130095182 n=1 Tax=Rhinichthys klamathensis goyatoka TaxID=3034132 RepID=UPI0024B4A71D|nr:uncharacterized protein LOC130095182 [Rhinichthys klamathensis goyatoka]